jgi:Bacterial Ig-like domain/Bacterial Ig domain
MPSELRMPEEASRGKAWILVFVTALAMMLLVAMFTLGAKPAFASGTVSVAVAGKGDATGTGISCNESGGPDCSEFYADTTYQECDPELKPPCHTVTEPPAVELTAGADRSGYAFDSWTGCDTVSLRTCELTVTDNRGVSARFRDIQAPQIFSLAPGSGAQRGTITLSANASDNSGLVSRVEFRVRGSLVATDTTAPYSASFNTASISDGSATIQATAVDAADLSTAISSTIVIDNSAPSLTVTSGPDGQTFGPGTTQTWTFSAGDSASGIQSVQCSVVPSGSTPSFGACSGASTSHSVTNQPHGNYTFSVRARDNAGLQATESRTFSIDATSPNTTITSGVANGARTNKRSLTWGFSSSEPGSSFECRVYPAALTPPTFGSCSGGTSHTASGFSPGTYTFEVRATDAVGNVDGTPAKRTFTVDTTRPTVTSVTPANLAKNVAPTANATATFSEAMKPSTINKLTFKLVKKGTTTPVQATISYSGKRAVLNPDRNLVRGATYKATVTTGAKDLAGNALSVSTVWSFTIER